MVGIMLTGIVAAATAAALVAAGSAASMVQLGPIDSSALFAFLLLGGAAFSRGSAASGLAMVILGLLLAVVGPDIETGHPRLTFGIPALENGLPTFTVALGLFVAADAIDELIQAMFPHVRLAGWADHSGSSFWRATILAVLAGFLPTNGGTLATTVTARRSRPRTDLFDPANQTSVAGIIRAAMLSDIRLSASLIPLLLWLVPVDAIIVFLHGPLYANQASDFPTTVWLGLATLSVAHILPIVVIMGFATARWRHIKINARVVAPLVLVAACLVCPLSDIGLMFVFGLLGYLMVHFGLDRSLMFYAYAVGATFEGNVRRSLLIMGGDPKSYIERPTSAAMLSAGVLIFIIARAWRYRTRLRSPDDPAAFMQHREI